MLKVHPGLPFECTYHFIAVDQQTFVMLDVIRSPRGNSLRFFVVQHDQLQLHNVIAEPSTGGSYLAPTGDRITRTGPGLQFDIAFSVKQSACAVAPVNPARVFAITAQDHPDVVYNGTLQYEASDGQKRQWTLHDTRGTISQHYGRTLPEYLYFNTYSDETMPQLVGAVSRVGTALGFRITSSYASLTTTGAAARTVISLVPRWRIGADGTVVIRSRHGDITIALGSQRLAHEIDHQSGTTWFDARVFVKGVTPKALPALVETRGPRWMEP